MAAADLQRDLGRVEGKLDSQPVVRSGNVIYNATGNLLGTAATTV